MTVDFKALINKPADKIKRPPVWPAGTYHGTIIRHEFGESSQKKTPFVSYKLKVNGPGEDVPQELLRDDEGKPFDLSKKEFKKDFYLTPDAEYRVVEFAESCGLQKSGHSLEDLILGVIGQPVLIQLIQKMSQDGISQFNDVGDIKGAQ